MPARLPRRLVTPKVAAATVGGSQVSLAEIKQAVAQLPPQELTALTAFLVQLDNAVWDKQIEADSAAGKLDFLFEEAEKERADGMLRDWPED